MATACPGWELFLHAGQGEEGAALPGSSPGAGGQVGMDFSAHLSISLL